jgi:hypothetical protein
VQQGVWRYWGRTLELRLLFAIQLQFWLAVNNLALVHNFNFQNNIVLRLSAEVFQIFQQRQALFDVSCHRGYLKNTLFAQ